MFESEEKLDVLCMTSGTSGPHTDSHVAISLSNKTVQTYDSTGSNVSVITGLNSVATSMYFSGSSNKLLTCHKDRKISIWNMSNPYAP